MNLDLNIIIPTYGPPDAEGVRPVTGYVPGYHVNTTLADLAAHPELEPYRVFPSRMRQLFAGDQWPNEPTWTVALRFADEAEARAAMPDARIEPDA